MIHSTNDPIEKVRALREQLSKKQVDLNNLLESFLKLGCEIFKLETGIVSQVEGGNYKIMAVSPNDYGFEKGSEFELAGTYCNEVFRHKKTVSVLEAGKTDPFRTHPVYENLKLESYISAPLFVRGEIYGTINFSSTTVRTSEFEQFDVDLIELMADSISSYIEED